MTPYDAEHHGPRRVVGPGFHERVHALVRAVPEGGVTTYGDVARALGLVSVARHVGWALAGLPEGSDVPWHRVVGGDGRVRRTDEPAGREQLRRLRREGVEVDAAGRIAGFAHRRHAHTGGRVP